MFWNYSKELFKCMPLLKDTLSGAEQLQFMFDSESIYELPDIKMLTANYGFYKNNGTVNPCVDEKKKPLPTSEIEKMLATFTKKYSANSCDQLLKTYCADTPYSSICKCCPLSDGYVNARRTKEMQLIAYILKSGGPLVVDMSKLGIDDLPSLINSYECISFGKKPIMMFAYPLLKKIAYFVTENAFGCSSRETFWECFCENTLYGCPGLDAGYGKMDSTAIQYCKSFICGLFNMNTELDISAIVADLKKPYVYNNKLKPLVVNETKSQAADKDHDLEPMSSSESECCEIPEDSDIIFCARMTGKSLSDIMHGNLDELNELNELYSLKDDANIDVVLGEVDDVSADNVSNTCYEESVLSPTVGIDELKNEFDDTQEIHTDDEKDISDQSDLQTDCQYSENDILEPVANVEPAEASPNIDTSEFSCEQPDVSDSDNTLASADNVSGNVVDDNGIDLQENNDDNAEFTYVEEYPVNKQSSADNTISEESISSDMDVKDVPCGKTKKHSIFDFVKKDKTKPENVILSDHEPIPAHRKINIISDFSNEHSMDVSPEEESKMEKVVCTEESVCTSVKEPESFESDNSSIAPSALDDSESIRVTELDTIKLNGFSETVQPFFTDFTCVEKEDNRGLIHQDNYKTPLSECFVEGRITTVVTSERIMTPERRDDAAYLQLSKELSNVKTVAFEPAYCDSKYGLLVYIENTFFVSYESDCFCILHTLFNSQSVTKVCLDIYTAARYVYMYDSSFVNVVGLLSMGSCFSSDNEDGSMRVLKILKELSGSELLHVESAIAYYDSIYQKLNNKMSEELIEIWSMKKGYLLSHALSSDVYDFIDDAAITYESGVFSYAKYSFSGKPGLVLRIGDIMVDPDIGDVAIYNKIMMTILRVLYDSYYFVKYSSKILSITDKELIVYIPSDKDMYSFMDVLLRVVSSTIKRMTNAAPRYSCVPCLIEESHVNANTL